MDESYDMNRSFGMKHLPDHWNDETFARCSILFKFEEGDNFNRRNILNILRIKI